MGMKEALSLGLELSSFFIASYLVHTYVASALGADENITLTSLMGLSLVIWTIHAFIYFDKRK